MKEGALTEAMMMMMMEMMMEMEAVMS